MKDSLRRRRSGTSITVRGATCRAGEKAAEEAYQKKGREKTKTENRRTILLWSRTRKTWRKKRSRKELGKNTLRGKCLRSAIGWSHLGEEGKLARKKMIKMPQNQRGGKKIARKKKDVVVWAESGRPQEREAVKPWQRDSQLDAKNMPRKDRQVKTRRPSELGN